MRKLFRALVVSLLLPLAICWAQDQQATTAQSDHEVQVQSTLAVQSDLGLPGVQSVNYPPLARQARIQGKVTFKLEMVDEKVIVVLVSGHPLLVPAANANLERFAARWYQAGIRKAEYTFQQKDSVEETRTMVPKDVTLKPNRFQRVVLRRQPTTRTIEEEKVDRKYHEIIPFFGDRVGDAAIIVITVEPQMLNTESSTVVA